MATNATNIADVDLIASLLRRYGRPTLEMLLKDRTTKKNIIWADREYEQLGTGYGPYDEVTFERVCGKRVIEPRVVKSVDQQAWRTKEKAEVFTPSWLCRKMVDCMDDAFFGSEPSGFVENSETGLTEERIASLAEKNRWQKYVDNRLLEITCGEAPFICSPYDATTGDFVPVEERIGFLDRKLRIVCRYAGSYDEWSKWAKRAVESSYGYEFQGDNLLIARINVFNTFADYMQYAWDRVPGEKEAREIAHVISWNLWQMDGLYGCVPSEWDIPEPVEPDVMQMSLFDLEGFMDEEEEVVDEEDVDQAELQFAEKCLIFDWRARASQTYESLKG